LRLAERIVMVKTETKFLENWKAKLAVLSAIVLPTITATGAFYDLKASITEKETVVNQRISALELETTKTFADKESIKDLRTEMKEMRADFNKDLNEIKTLIIRSNRSGR
jgi:hypothetical protein